MESSDPTSRFIELYEEIAAPLRAWASLQARGPLGGSLEAEDLVQEVCFAALRNFASWDPERGSFRAWVFGVAQKVSASILRKLVRRAHRAGPMEPLPSRNSQLPDAATTISRRIARREDVQRFLGRMDELEEDERTLLRYRGLEGLSHRQVASLLRIDEELARKRWQRLLSKLRQGPLPTWILE